MLTVQQKNRIIEKIIQDKNGNLFRAYFVVVEKNGKFFGRLVKVEPIIKEESRIKNQESRICLPIFHSSNFLPATSYKLQAILSPFFLNTFFTSQMTRAPSK